MLLCTACTQKIAHDQKGIISDESDRNKKFLNRYSSIFGNQVFIHVPLQLDLAGKHARVWRGGGEIKRWRFDEQGRVKRNGGGNT